MALFGGYYMDKEEKRAQKHKEFVKDNDQNEDLWSLYKLRREDPTLIDLMESPHMCELRAMFTPAHQMGAIAIDDIHQLVMLKPYRFIDLYYYFNEIRDYELLETNAQVSGGGITGAAIGGLLFGGAGLVAGSVLGKNSKSMAQSLFIRVDLIDLDSPCVYVNFLSRPVTKTSAEYQEALKNAHDSISRLNIALKREDQAEQAPQPLNNPYDEIKQLKELLDIGAITQQEFNLKKQSLLGI